MSAAIEYPEEPVVTLTLPLNRAKALYAVVSNLDADAAEAADPGDGRTSVEERIDWQVYRALKPYVFRG